MARELEGVHGRRGGEKGWDLAWTLACIPGTNDVERAEGSAWALIC